MDNTSNVKDFKEALQAELDKELDSRETFPPKIQEQIKETYKKLWAERLAWIEEKKKEQESQKKEELP